MKYWPIKFDDVRVSYDVPLWKQILWLEIYEWDEYPHGLTVRILGINFDFFLGSWK